MLVSGARAPLHESSDITVVTRRRATGKRQIMCQTDEVSHIACRLASTTSMHADAISAIRQLSDILRQDDSGIVVDSIRMTYDSARYANHGTLVDLRPHGLPT